MTFVIGAGGVGSWLTPGLCMLNGRDDVTVVDGDTLEPKNLNRQLYDASYLGWNKAEALARLYGCQAKPQYYGAGSLRLVCGDSLIVAADNHPARAAALSDGDAHGVHVLIAANEATSSEAYIYLPAWRGTGADPRLFYPEILTGREDDPLGQAIGCTGQAQVRTPQLASANMMAASLALHLFMVWFLKARQLDQEIRERLPHHLRVNMTGMEVKRLNQSIGRQTE